MPLPNSLEALGLHNCDGIPCLPGVELGITQRSTIETLFFSLPSFQSDSKGTYFQQVGLNVYDELYYNTVGQVNSVMVTRNNLSPVGQLGMIFAEYGYPCGIAYDFNVTYYVSLVYPHFELGMTLHPYDKFDQYSPVDSVVVGEFPNCTNETGLIRWHGFSSKYFPHLNEVFYGATMKPNLHIGYWGINSTTGLRARPSP